MSRRDAIKRFSAVGATLAPPAYAQSRPIALGQSAAFSEPASELGLQFKLGAMLYSIGGLVAGLESLHEHNLGGFFVDCSRQKHTGSIPMADGKFAVKAPRLCHGLGALPYRHRQLTQLLLYGPGADCWP